MAPPKLRVICSPVASIGVTEPFVVRLDPSTSKPLGHDVMSAFRSEQPVVQVFRFDGAVHSLLAPDMFTVVNSAYTGSDAFVVHVTFHVPYSPKATFQLRVTWTALGLNTASAPFKLEPSSSMVQVVQVVQDKRATKRKRADEAPQECMCLQHVTMLHEQITLMREEILGYRALLNDTLVKYMQPLGRTNPPLPEPLLGPLPEPLLEPLPEPLLEPFTKAEELPSFAHELAPLSSVELEQLCYLYDI